MSNLFNVQFSTKRLTSPTGGKQTYLENLTNQSCFIQPLQEEFTGTQSVIKLIMYCERIDVQDADVVVIDNIEYTIKEIRDYNYGGFPHLKVFLTHD